MSCALICALVALSAGPSTPVGVMAEESREMKEAFSDARSGRVAQGMKRAFASLRRVRSRTGELHPRYSRALDQLIDIFDELGDFASSAAALVDQRRITLHVYGERSLPHAESLRALGWSLLRLGKLREADEAASRALKLSEALVGENSFQVQTCLNTLSQVRSAQGRLGETCEILRRALRSSEKSGRGDSLGHTTMLHNLALAYHNGGDYARAEPLYRSAEKRYRKTRADYPIKWAVCLTALGSLYFESGDCKRAARAYEQASTVFTGSLENHPQHATLLNNRAMLARALSRPREALDLMEKSLAMEIKSSGPNSLDVAVKRHNIAKVLRQLGENKKAEQMLREAQRAREKAGAKGHPNYAAGLMELAHIAADRGDLAVALDMTRRASKLIESIGGPTHSYMSESLGDEGRYYWQRGDLRQARRLLGRALDVAWLNMERSAGAMAERQQLAQLVDLRAHLDMYLSLGGAEAYPRVLAWKGAVSGRQTRMRRMAQSSADPKVRAIAQDLASESRRLALLAGMQPPADKTALYRAAVEKAANRVEELEQDLARADAAFAAERKQGQITPKELAARLPKGAALVDILSYSRRYRPTKPGQKWKLQTELVAFVLRPGKPVARVDLGPADAVERCVTAWRKAATNGAIPEEEGKALAKQLLTPLRPHLDGVTTLLVSPDGPTARVPWAALPGRKEGSYLLEEMAVAVVPVPRQLPEGKAEEGKPTLLAVGGVDFGSAPSSSTTAGLLAMRGGDEKEWPALPATTKEGKAVAAAFRKRFPSGKATTLTGKEASEEAVRRLVPGRAYLHFATHGYFASGKLKSLLGGKGSEATGAPVEGLPPGLLSGLVLAGANRPPSPDRDDGILTAREVAELPLSGCRLAVLSACETGLGPTAGGEGLLGLQRAFQTAGCRSAVTSLWSVPDGFTHVLMERFYDNLWQKKMSSLEALRQAQLYVLREGRVRHPELMRSPRLLSMPKPKKKDGRLPPLFWAAWVLSGDWR
jgi:CHAT domain-containing protein